MRDNRVFNVYYITADGTRQVACNHYLDAAMLRARAILFSGGEVTGIIDAAKDKGE